MPILDAIDSTGKPVLTGDLRADKSTWSFHPPLKCGKCKTMVVSPVRAHKRLGKVKDPTFAAANHLAHKISGCEYASTSQTPKSASQTAMPIRLQLLPNKPKRIDQSITNLTPLYPMADPRPRRAFRIGNGPKTGRLVVQTAHHAAQLVQAIESSIKDGALPHDMIYEGVRVPWENFYFDTTIDPAAWPWDQPSTTTTHPIAVKLVCGAWEEKAGQYRAYLKSTSPRHRKLVLATSQVAQDKLPADGTTVLFYGEASDLGWLWFKDSRNLHTLSRPGGS